MKPLVIYHADCTDGYGAAFAAWLKLGDEAEYLPMNYNEGIAYGTYQDREVYVLDFSFPRPIMEQMFVLAKRVVWIDHHKTAFEMWCVKSYQEKGRFFNTTYPHHIHLDIEKSGALLAWEYFHPGTSVPMLIQHIDDRDRWQFKIEGSKELHAALASYRPWSFTKWDDGLGVLTPAGLETLKQEGTAILRAQDQNVQQMAKQARKCVIHARHRDYPVVLDTTPFPGLAVNASLHQSEVGHELANQSGTYGLVWYLGADNKVRCSLRSNGDYDVSAIAKSFGGGGHRNAAGFETDIPTLMGWLK